MTGPIATEDGHWFGGVAREVWVGDGEQSHGFLEQGGILAVVRSTFFDGKFSPGYLCGSAMASSLTWAPSVLVGNELIESLARESLARESLARESLARESLAGQNNMIVMTGMSSEAGGCPLVRPVIGVRHEAFAHSRGGLKVVEAGAAQFNSGPSCAQVKHGVLGVPGEGASTADTRVCEANRSGIDQGDLVQAAQHLLVRVSRNHDGRFGREHLEQFFAWCGRVNLVVIRSGAAMRAQDFQVANRYLEGGHKAAHKFELMQSDLFAAPAFRSGNQRVGVLVKGWLKQPCVGVAHDHGDAQFVEAVDHAGRLRAHHGDITEADDTADVFTFEFGEHRFKGGQVAVNVGKDGEFHVRSLTSDCVWRCDPVGQSRVEPVSS
jgi:hypothetical protein